MPAYEDIPADWKAQRIIRDVSITAALLAEKLPHVIDSQTRV